MRQLGFSIDSIFSRLQKVNGDFNIDRLKEELTCLAGQKGFEWVDLALETKFVHGAADYYPPKKLDVDELIIYTDLAQSSYDFPDGRPTFDDRERLKDQFKVINIHNFLNIHEMMDSIEFSWVPFEIKRTFKHAFGEVYYTNDDIIYEIKKEAWDYLFPSNVNVELLEELSLECNLRVKNYDLNSGWMDMDDLVAGLSISFPGVDLFTLTKIKWDGNMQKLNHFRNPIAMGFRRLKVKR